MSLENILELDKKLVIKFKKGFILLNMSFKLTLKLIYLAINHGRNYSGWKGMDWKIAHYESYEETDHKNKHIIREYQISGW